MADGVEGEVHVRSTYNMLGYWNDADATRKTLKPNGWLATGDIGRLEQGMLTINSRARDMIIRGGENVYPIEVERRLDAYDGVVESAVIGVDHPALGQEVKAIVVPVAGTELDVEALAQLDPRDACAVQGADIVGAAHRGVTAQRVGQGAEDRARRRSVGSSR